MIEDLLKEREYLIDLSEISFKKLVINAEVEGGSRISILLKEGTKESGYLFELPNISNKDTYDLFVHITGIENEGIDEVPDLFCHLYDLLINSDVLEIVIYKD